MTRTFLCQKMCRLRARSSLSPPRKPLPTCLKPHSLRLSLRRRTQVDSPLVLLLLSPAAAPLQLRRSLHSPPAIPAQEDPPTHTSRRSNPHSDRAECPPEFRPCVLLWDPPSDRLRCLPLRQQSFPASIPALWQRRVLHVLRLSDPLAQAQRQPLVTLQTPLLPLLIYKKLQVLSNQKTIQWM